MSFARVRKLFDLSGSKKYNHRYNIKRFGGNESGYSKSEKGDPI